MNGQATASAQDFFGGGGGIRTHERLAPLQHFECCALVHYATPPPAIVRAAVSGLAAVPSESMVAVPSGPGGRVAWVTMTGPIGRSGRADEGARLESV